MIQFTKPSMGLPGPVKNRKGGLVKESVPGLSHPLGVPACVLTIKVLLLYY